jgi:hypothetical protein
VSTLKTIPATVDWPSAAPLPDLLSGGEVRVGIGLIVEVLTCAPDALGPSERMVLVVLAEDARDATRESWALNPEELGRRAGLKPAALQKAFQRLAKAGLEVRVPLKVGKDGRPVYAYEGKKATYRLPQLKRVESVPPSEAGTESTLSTQEARTDSALSGQEGGTESTLSSQEGGTESYQGGTPSTLWGSEGGTGSSEGGTSSAPTPQYPSTTSPPSEKKGGAGGRTQRAPKTTNGEHPRFAEWYAAYPLRKDRGAAAKAFNGAVKKVDDIEVLFTAVKRYIESDPNVARGFIKYPATWLNKQSWLDEPTPLADTGTDGRPQRPGAANGSTFGVGPLANVNDLWRNRR